MSSWRRVLPVCLGLAMLTPVVRSKERSWGVYYNPQSQYCMSYPSNWSRQEASDGAGMFVRTRVKGRLGYVGEMDVQATPDQHTTLETGLPTSLVEHHDEHLKHLKKFARAQDLEVLEQKQIAFYGSSGLFTKVRYYDPQEGTAWVVETIFAHRAGRLYRLQLICRAGEAARFEPIFSRATSSFQFNCPERVAAESARSSRRDDRPPVPVVRPVPQLPRAY